jgi:hypothetical protein
LVLGKAFEGAWHLSVIEPLLLQRDDVRLPALVFGVADRASVALVMDMAGIFSCLLYISYQFNVNASSAARTLYPVRGEKILPGFISGGD